MPDAVELLLSTGQVNTKEVNYNQKTALQLARESLYEYENRVLELDKKSVSFHGIFAETKKLRYVIRMIQEYDKFFNSHLKAK